MPEQAIKCKLGDSLDDDCQEILNRLSKRLDKSSVEEYDWLSIESYLEAQICDKFY